MSGRSVLGKWFLTREPRERILLLATAVVVTLWVGWQLLLQPLNEARNISLLRVQAAEQSLTRVQDMASALTAQRLEEPVADRSLVQRVNDAAQQQGLDLAALEPSSDSRSVMVRLDEVPVGTLFVWLASLESQADLWVDSLTVTADTAADRVNASARVRQ